MNIQFPSANDKVQERRRIGQWISRKREEYHKGKLLQRWIDKFEQTFPGWSWNPQGEGVRENKVKLLEMAQRGESRPHFRSPMGTALLNYTTKSAMYDPEFDNKIRSGGQHWFIKTADVKKKQLLKMARQGKSRPHSRTKLGKAFNSYTCNCKTHDPIFIQKIREIAPRWLANKMLEKKSELLRMARNQEPRPNCRTSLGGSLVDYTGKSKSSYDPNFDKEIREIVPNWFVCPSDTPPEKKRQLLEMAQNGDPRPHFSTKLGRDIIEYANPRRRSYDVEFSEKIRALSPHWFVNTADEKKKKFLEMARNGESKPNWKTKLRTCLDSYVGRTNNAFDADFSAQIIKSAPHWFKSK